MPQHNILKDYAEKEQLLKKLREQLDALENDPRLKADLEFKDKLESLMNEYDKSGRDVIGLLAPGSSATRSAENSGGERRRRKLKIYQNPNSGDVIETRGGNHKTLKGWKKEHGDETVESWLVRVK